MAVLALVTLAVAGCADGAQPRSADLPSSPVGVVPVNTTLSGGTPTPAGGTPTGSPAPSGDEAVGDRMTSGTSSDSLLILGSGNRAEVLAAVARHRGVVVREVRQTETYTVRFAVPSGAALEEIRLALVREGIDALPLDTLSP